MMWKLLLPIFIVALFATGCFPYHFTTRPGVSGRLIDAQTEAPIQGANVRLKISEKMQVSDEEVEAVAGSDGQFSIPPRKQWGIYIVPMDVFGMGWTLTIDAFGYEKYQTDFAGWPMGQSIIEFGPIRLQKH